MPAHVYHIVDSAHDPEISVLILSCAVSRKINIQEFGEVLLLESLRIFEDASQHPGPGFIDNKKTAFAGLCCRSVFLYDLRFDTEEWPRCRTGFCCNGSGKRSYHDG